MLERFLSDDRGTETLEQVALLGFIVMPLLAVLIKFRTVVTQKFVNAWTDLAK